MPDATPAVSVVLPTYNRSGTLGRAMRSVLDQTCDDIELLVVDDASTDDTDEVISSFEDDRLTVLSHDENRGAAAARNTGVKASDGEFVGFQDSDDEWHRTKLARQLAAFEERPADVGVVYSQLRRHALDGAVNVLPRNPPEGDVHHALLRSNSVSVQTALVRASCFEDHGLFDERFPRLIDWEWWIRVSTTHEFHAVREPLVDSYVQPDSISVDRDALVVARERLVEKHRHRMDRETVGAHLFRTGHAALKAGEGEIGKRYLSEAVRVHPRLTYVTTRLVAALGPTNYARTYRTVKALRRTIHG